MSDGRCPYCFSLMTTGGCSDTLCRGDPTKVCGMGGCLLRLGHDGLCCFVPLSAWPPMDITGGKDAAGHPAAGAEGYPAVDAIFRGPLPCGHGMTGVSCNTCHALEGGLLLTERLGHLRMLVDDFRKAREGGLA
jgi:hypothetical protein